MTINVIPILAILLLVVSQPLLLAMTTMLALMTLAIVILAAFLLLLKIPTQITALNFTAILKLVFTTLL